MASKRHEESTMKSQLLLKTARLLTSETLHKPAHPQDRLPCISIQILQYTAVAPKHSLPSVRNWLLVEI